MLPSETNKLYKPIAADFKIITRKTGLWTLEYCEQILHDIKVMLANDFLEKISLILDKPKDNPIKVKQFQIGSSLSTISDRPGDNDWEEGDGVSLRVILSYTQLWLTKSEEDKLRFQRENFTIGWVPVSLDTNFSSLQNKTTKLYSTGLNSATRIDFN